MQGPAPAFETVRRSQEAPTPPPESVPARIEKAAQPARPRRSRTHPVAVSTASWSLAGTYDLIELCRLLHQAVGRQMDATIFFLGLFDGTSETVEVVWQNENGHEPPGGSFPLGKGLTSEVLRSGRARLIKRWSSEGPRVQVQYATGTPGLPESAVAAPLRLGNNVIGVISVESYQRGAYGAQEVRM